MENWSPLMTADDLTSICYRISVPKPRAFTTTFSISCAARIVIRLAFHCLGAVHVRMWAKDEDCDEKRSATPVLLREATHSSTMCPTRPLAKATESGGSYQNTSFDTALFFATGDRRIKQIDCL